MKHDSIIQNLKQMGLLLAVWLCAACTSSAGVEATAPTRMSCVANAGHDITGCAQVIGDLRIENSDLENLGHLATLRSVTGTLFVSGNPQLKSLAGLEQLREVGELVVVNNAKLEDVSSLMGLVRAQRISVAHNPELRVLAGFDAIEHVQSLALMHNGLVRVKGFDSLRSAGQVTISDNARLIFIAGLTRLSVVEDLSLENNPRLAPTPGLFENLARVEGSFSHSGSPAIANLDLAPSTDRMETASR